MAAATVSCTFLPADTAKPPLIAWPGPTAMRAEPPFDVREMVPTAMALARALPGFLSESAAERARESAMKPVEMALATESEMQSMQPVPELDVAAASPWKTPMAPACALERLARPSLVSAEDATLDCAWITPVDTPMAMEPAEPASVPEDEATVALPCSTPMP
ncbi:hypothetical protein COO60DRAFT_1483048 [Scenedesmus sp. NREL 46B-D3]|nr:hypothetical protein COO60DRAFT_1483048 [Scenedesmus sp. NREL 46B-D3]